MNLPRTCVQKVIESMSTESPSDQPAFSDAGSRRAARRTGRVPRPLRIVVYGVLVAIVVLAIREFPREVARWYFAAALESVADGNSSQAIVHVNRAVDWDPQCSRHFGLRAQLNLAAGDIEASLADCDRAIENMPADWETYFTRTVVYQRLGRHAEAVRDWDAIVAEQRRQFEQRGLAVGERLAEALNGRAYSRALGQIDIQKGLGDIEEAFDMLGTEESSHMLDTRGYLRYLAGDMPQAREDMERAVELAEASAQLGLLRQAGSLSASQNLMPDVKTRHVLAVLYHHRGLIYEKLGKSEEARADLELAENLGYDPENGVW